MGPNATGSRQTNRGHVTQRPKNAGKKNINLGCAFAVEGHGNDGLSLIGGKVAALAVMIDAIPGLLLGLSQLWLARVVIGSFPVLHKD
jgi:hypothetical protein